MKAEIPKNIKEERDPGKLRSIQTFCKSINKFKSNYKKSQYTRKTVNKGKVNYLVKIFAQKLARSKKNHNEKS